MALAEVPGGIRGLTRFGDIVDWSLDLVDETVVHDQPDDQQLDIVRGGFGVFFGSGVHALNRQGVGSYDYRWHSGTPGGSWEAHSISFTMDAIGLAAEPGPWPPQHITVVGSDTGSLARIVSTSNGGAGWQREAQDVPASADHPLIDIAIIPSADGGPPLRMAVGNSGTVLVSPMNSTIFADGFESGDTSAW